MLSEEETKKISDGLNTSNINNLLQYKQTGLVSKVEILATSDSCEHYKKQQGKIYTIEEAIRMRPLPCKKCNHEIGYCRCIYRQWLSRGMVAGYLASCYSIIMKMSEYQKKKIEDRQRKAIKLYKQGLTTREIGKALERSHTWVWNAVRKMSTVGAVDKS